jgi:hypothetical protein
MPKVTFLSLFLFLGMLAPAFSQNKQGTGLSIVRTHEPIKIDGEINEPAWKEAKVATDFYLNYPIDSLPPSFQTEARVMYDDDFFYVSFVCYDDSRPNVVQSLRRDYEWQLNDNVGFTLDPYNDFTSGFYFSITPYGVQREGIVSYGGSDPMQSYNNNWDNKWYSAVTRHEDKWIAEMAIPFKSFRYNRNQSEWNIGFVRQDLKRNEVSSWIVTPIQFIPGSFAYCGRLQWQETPPHAGTNISLIPYAITSLSKDNEAGTRDNVVTAGFDAKVSVTPSLNLDLTINPDFSTVEVDRQVINLTRFEFQFPERRQFFLENSDLFSAPGFESITQPFFSRRIGLAEDTTGYLEKVPIMYGLRLSGKLGANWRVGLMNMHTREKASLGLPDQNYTVAVVQRQILERSNIDFFIVNKQSFGLGEYDPSKYYHESLVKEVWNGSDSVNQLTKFNRVVGTDFNFFTASNRWGGKAYYHHSFDDYSTGAAYSYGGFLSYNTRSLSLMAGTIGLGKDFRAETGFVPSQSVYPGSFGGIIIGELKFYPKSGPIVQMRPGITIDNTTLPDGTLTDMSYSLTYNANFRNTGILTASLKNVFQKLPQDFDVLDPEGDSTLLKGEEYLWNEFTIRYNSDSRKLFTYIVTAGGGEFYNGHRLSVAGTVSYRIQPYGSISVTGDYNDLRLPPEYGSAKFILLSPRLDFTLTDKLFLTTFLQYNDRYDNVNLNARFQWRYKPASDFFVVYTENYLPEGMQSKNRSLVFKFTYWLNI